VAFAKVLVVVAIFFREQNNRKLTNAGNWLNRQIKLLQKYSFSVLAFSDN
jgi:hypothetical protein